MDLGHQLRSACLVIWLDLTEDSELSNLIRGELWCLQNDVDTTAFPDLTLAHMKTQEIVDAIFENSTRTRDEHSAYVLTAMKELVNS